MGDTRSRRANPGRASARRSGAGGAGISACPTQSMATQGKPLHLCRAVTPALAGVGLWHNAHRPHGSGSLSVQTPVWIGAQGTARPICPYVSRADGGNMGRDRIAWRVLLGRGEGRRRGGAGRRLCCSWSAGWSVSCGTVRGLVGRVAAVLPASLVVSCSPLPFPCGSPLSPCVVVVLKKEHSTRTLLDTNNEGNDHTGRRMTLGKRARERIGENRSPGRMEGGAPGPRTKQVSVFGRGVQCNVH